MAGAASLLSELRCRSDAFSPSLALWPCQEAWKKELPRRANAFWPTPSHPSHPSHVFCRDIRTTYYGRMSLPITCSSFIYQRSRPHHPVEQIDCRVPRHVFIEISLYPHLLPARRHVMTVGKETCLKYYQVSTTGMVCGKFRVELN